MTQLGKLKCLYVIHHRILKLKVFKSMLTTCFRCMLSVFRYWSTHIKLLKQRKTNLALFIWRRVGPANYTVPENTNDLDVAACKESNVQ